MAVFTIDLSREELLATLPYLEEHELARLAWMGTHGCTNKRLFVPHGIDDFLHALQPFCLTPFFDVEFRYHCPWLCRVALVSSL